MKHYYQAELESGMNGYRALVSAMATFEHQQEYRRNLDIACNRFKATMAATTGGMDTKPRLERKGRTLLVKRGDFLEGRR